LAVCRVDQGELLLVARLLAQEIGAGLVDGVRRSGVVLLLRSGRYRAAEEGSEPPVIPRPGDGVEPGRGMAQEDGGGRAAPSAEKIGLLPLALVAGKVRDEGGGAERDESRGDGGKRELAGREPGGEQQ